MNNYEAEDFVLHTQESPRIDNIDSSDIGNVISGVNALVENARDYKYLEAERLFEVGCLLNETNAAISQREYADILGVGQHQISDAKRVAGTLMNDKERFVKEMERLDNMSWYSLKKRLLPPVKVSVTNALKALSKRVSRAFNDIGGMERADYNGFRRIKNMLRRYIPDDENISDLNYLEYSPCCCCGSGDIPPDGNNIQSYKGLPHISYPVCDDCLEKQKKPDPERVMAIYAAYAINLERSIIEGKIK